MTFLKRKCRALLFLSTISIFATVLFWQWEATPLMKVSHRREETHQTDKNGLIEHSNVVQVNSLEIHENKETETNKKADNVHKIKLPKKNVAELEEKTKKGKTEMLHEQETKVNEMQKPDITEKVDNTKKTELAEKSDNRNNVKKADDTKKTDEAKKSENTKKAVDIKEKDRVKKSDNIQKVDDTTKTGKAEKSGITKKPDNTIVKDIERKQDNKKSENTKEADSKLVKTKQDTSDKDGVLQNTAISSNVTKRISSERYIIYVCDKTDYCYGLGDRQRAIVFMYVLALMTNRKFGIIWSQPCPIQQFLGPNKIQWDIPKEKLEGKSSFNIKLLGPTPQLDLSTPFNKQFPQDVVYIRTNQLFIWGLRSSPYYAPRLPSWTKQRLEPIFGKLWTEMMYPKPSIRKPVNEMLVQIHQSIHNDSKIQELFTNSVSCQKSCEYLSTLGLLNSTASWGKINNLTRILGGIINNTFNDCLKKIEKSGLMATSKKRITPSQFPLFCDSESKRKIEKSSENQKLLSNSLHNLTVDSIRSAKGFDVISLNMMCVHVRIGHSKGMPFEGKRNSMESVQVLWEFLKPYVAAGKHIYLASDFEEVRAQGRALFGHRIHTGNGPIIHIASVQKNQDEVEGMKFVMWEQLLLMTSCPTLVRSLSGFSSWAHATAVHLGATQKLHVFKGGKVTP